MVYMLYTLPLQIVQEKGVETYEEMVISSHIFEREEDCAKASIESLEIRMEMINLVMTHENENIITAVPACLNMGMEI